MAKPGRNKPCPCGSGKKFKKCHGGPESDASPPISGRAVGKPPEPQVGAEFPFPGLGGISERITTVPHYENGPLGPDNVIGSPGMYTAIFVFARSSEPTPSIIGVEPNTEGDSYVQWAAVPPPGSSDFHLNLSTATDSRKIDFHLRANSRDFIARADTSPFDAANFTDAERAAYRGIAPALSHWTAELDVPILVREVYLHELATGARCRSIVSPFSEVRFHPKGAGSLGVEYRLYASLYREGLIGNRSAYQYLCFYKILEGIFARRSRIDAEQVAGGGKPQRQPERIPAAYDEIGAWLDSLFVGKRFWNDYTVRTIVPQEALGKKVLALRDKLAGIRNGIAHALTEDREPVPVTDEYLEPPDLIKWLPLVRCLARLLMRNEFPTEFLVRE